MDTQHISIECHYAECRYAECSDFFIVRLGVMLSVVEMNVVMLSVVEPFMNVCNKLDCSSLASFSSLF
jgi:hypothetical protein